MLEQIKAEVQSSIVPLVQGIFADGESLLRQELALAKSEINQEIQKAKGAALSFAAGVGLAAAAALLLCLTLVHMIVWAFPKLELWVSYGIVTGAIGCAAGLLLFSGRKQANDISPVMHETIDSMKENAQWLKQKI